MNKKITGSKKSGPLTVGLKNTGQKNVGQKAAGQKIVAKKTKKRRKKAVRIWPKLLLLAVFAVLCAAILAVDIVAPQISLEKGEVADADVFYSGNTVAYASQLRTAAARTAAASQVEQVFTIDETVLPEVVAQINADFATLDDLRNNTILGEQDRLTALGNALHGAYEAELLEYVLEANFGEVYSLRQNLRSAMSTVYDKGVRDDELSSAKAQIAALLDETSVDDMGKQFMRAYLGSFTLMANDHYDALKTVAAMDEAMEAVGIMQVTVQNGEKLLSKGSVITAEQIEALQALNMYRENDSYAPYIGLLTIVLLLFILLAYYLSYYQPKLFVQDKTVLLLGVIMVLVLLLSKLVSFINFSADSEAAAQIGYLLPVATASMLLAVLLERNLAIFATIIMSVFVGIICDGNAAYALVALGGGLAGVISTTRLNQRSQFVGASIYIALTNMALIGAHGLLYNQSYPLIGMGIMTGLLNGFLSSILAMGILPFLESAFGVTTMVRLLELSNSNHPLMKRLMLEAPGTYNHSVLVGNLAEAAADAIGADTLLVRVASHYHDIGKLKRPYFFIENQGLNDNPHDKLQPSLSYMILTSHVREGVEMLREKRFPKEIIALVEQHHGTGLLRLIYQKALEQALDKDNVFEDDFRYPYSKPQSKEAALVFLADSTQAAVQSMKQAVKGDVEDMVHKVIQSKVADGQLQECPITFQDLQIIEESFLRVLSGMNHSRLVYPEQVAKEMGGKMNAPLPKHPANVLDAVVGAVFHGADKSASSGATRGADEAGGARDDAEKKAGGPGPTRDSDKRK